MNLQTRIEKLEKDIDTSDSNLELFDINGEQVSAKIKIMPQTWGRGLAVLSNGTEIEIAPSGNWTDIIFQSERLLNSEIQTRQEEQESQEDCLFLRKSGQVSAVELICRANND